MLHLLSIYETKELYTTVSKGDHWYRARLCIHFLIDAFYFTNLYTQNLHPFFFKNLHPFENIYKYMIKLCIDQIVRHSADTFLLTGTDGKTQPQIKKVHFLCRYNWCRCRMWRRLVHSWSDSEQLVISKGNNLWPYIPSSTRKRTPWRIYLTGQHKNQIKFVLIGVFKDRLLHSTRCRKFLSLDLCVANNQWDHVTNIFKIWCNRPVADLILGILELIRKCFGNAIYQYDVSLLQLVLCRGRLVGEYMKLFWFLFFQIKNMTVNDNMLSFMDIFCLCTVQNIYFAPFKA